jgi:hypothetical protein
METDGEGEGEGDMYEGVGGDVDTDDAEDGDTQEYEE